MGMWLTAHVSRLAAIAAVRQELAWRAFVMLTPVFAWGGWDCFDASVHSGVLLGAFGLVNQECGLRGNLHRRLCGLGVGHRRLRHAQCWPGSCSMHWAACLKWIGFSWGVESRSGAVAKRSVGSIFCDVGRCSSELGLWFSGHTFCFFWMERRGRLGGK